MNEQGQPPPAHAALSPRAQVHRAPPVTPHHNGSGTGSGARGMLSPTKPTLHLSPRKFQQLQQQQRQAVLRGMLPLSPIRPQQQQQCENHDRKSTSREPATVPWNPAWLPFPIDTIPVALARDVGASGLSYGTATLDAWLQSYDQDILQFESLEAFVQVKLPEALAFCHKMEQQIAEAQEKERTSAIAQTHFHSSSPSQRSGRTKATKKLRYTTTTTAMSRFPVRFRIAVFANLLERAIVAMTQSASLAHLRPWLLQARQELFRAVFADYDEYSRPRKSSKPTNKKTKSAHGAQSTTDHDTDNEDNESDDESGDDSEDDSAVDSESGSQQPQQQQYQQPSKTRTVRGNDPLGPDAPRPLSFFLSRVPFLLKLQDDTQRRTARFQRHQVALRRIVQSLYRSLGTVFHAWKMYVRQVREDRLNHKGAQLTAMVVIQRGLVRAIFVEWTKCVLTSKLTRAQEREAHLKRSHDERVSELYKELFLLQEQNARLQIQVHASAMRGQPVEIHEIGDEEESDEEEREEIGDDN